MAIEVKEVLDYLGLKADEIKSVDDLKTNFDKEFVRASLINEDHPNVKAILGKTFGTLENEIKKVAKGHDLEIDFDTDDLKGKKVTEKLKHVFGEYDKKKAATIADLEKKATQGNDDKVKEWETKYTKLQTKYNDTESLLKTTTTDFEGFKQSTQKEIKAVKINVHKKDLWGKAKFVPDANEYAIKGFKNEFEEKYQIDLDEKDQLVVLDKEGKAIPNPKVTGKFYTPEDLLVEEMVKAKIFQLNPAATKQNQRQVLTPNAEPPNNNQQRRQPAQRMQ